MEPTEEERQRLAYWRGQVDQKNKDDEEKDRVQLALNERIDKRLNKIETKLNGIETKIKIYSALGGAVGSAVMLIIVQIVGSK